MRQAVARRALPSLGALEALGLKELLDLTKGLGIPLHEVFRRAKSKSAVIGLLLSVAAEPEVEVEA